MERLLADVAAQRLPPRRERSNPRVVKRKLAKFPRKRPKHAAPPLPLPVAAALHILLN